MKVRKIRKREAANRQAKAMLVSRIRPSCVNATATEMIDRLGYEVMQIYAQEPKSRQAGVKA